jgi:hypothetical protein
MIECYYKWCPHHEYHEYGDKSEPFCMLDCCIAKEDDILIYKEKRRKEIEGSCHVS